MTEKVKITREQAKVIESKMAFRHMSIKYHVMNNWDTDYERCLNNLTLDELIRAFYIGYEVEPKIKVGDFVEIEMFGTRKVFEVTGVKGNAIAINGGTEYNEYYVSRILTDEEKRKEKQHRWWAKHGREVKEVKKGDIVKTVNGKMIEINHAEQLPNRFKVACFAEDRKDVEQ